MFVIVMFDVALQCQVRVRWQVMEFLNGTSSPLRLCGQVSSCCLWFHDNSNNSNNNTTAAATTTTITTTTTTTNTNNSNKQPRSPNQKPHQPLRC